MPFMDGEASGLLLLCSGRRGRGIDGTEGTEGNNIGCWWLLHTCMCFLFEKCFRLFCFVFVFLEVFLLSCFQDFSRLNEAMEKRGEDGRLLLFQSNISCFLAFIAGVSPN